MNANESELPEGLLADLRETMIDSFGSNEVEGVMPIIKATLRKYWPKAVKQSQDTKTKALIAYARNITVDMTHGHLCTIISDLADALECREQPKDADVMKESEGRLTIEPGDVFVERDPRGNGRRVRVVEYGTKTVDVMVRGRWVKKPVECVVCQVVGTTRRVKISQHTLSRRYRKVEV